MLQYDRAFFRGYRPSPRITVSEWSDRHRVLAGRTAAEKGPWRTDKTPYLRDIMDDLSAQSPVERVVFMKGTQLGATEAGTNWLGYIMASCPGPSMMVLPTVDMAKRSSRQRIDSLIEYTDVLDQIVAPSKSRDSGNTMLSKEFPGGILVMTGANSAVGLRSMPVKYLFVDEVDGYPLDLDEEGDPVELAIERTATFARRKVFIVSTPTIEGRSRIQAEYEDTDQRKFFVPCPHCGHMQTLEWEQVRWTDLGIPPEQAVYLCIECEQSIENRQKTWMLPRGEWRPTATGRPNVRGYHLSGLYRPVGWKSWGDMAVERVKAGKNPARIKSFVNKLGLTFKESGEAPPWRTLFDRREDWHPGEVQPGVLALTCGVDVQKDRLEALVVGWGRNQERWTVDRRVLVGDPAKSDVWRALDRLLVEDFRHPSGGSLSIVRMFIDIGGHFTDEVYSWAGKHQPSVVMPIMGNVRTSVPIGTPHFVERTVNGKKIKRGAQMTPVNSSMFKSRIYNLLRLEPPIGEDEPFPEGFIHIGQYDDEFFQQLTAERLVRRVNKAGFAKLEWEKERERNEVLDIMVYAGAAAMSLGIHRWEADDWQGIEDSIRTAEPRAMATAQEAGVWRWGSL